jgi:hypothetical protein
VDAYWGAVVFSNWKSRSLEKRHLAKFGKGRGIFVLRRCWRMLVSFDKLTRLRIGRTRSSKTLDIRGGVVENIWFVLIQDK